MMFNWLPCSIGKVESRYFKYKCTCRDFLINRLYDLSHKTVVESSCTISINNSSTTEQYAPDINVIFLIVDISAGNLSFPAEPYVVLVEPIVH